MTFADRILSKLSPIKQASTDLVTYITGICSVMFQDVEDLASDTDVAVGWSVMMDLDAIPTEGLSWLGQFIGVQVDTRLDDAGQRNQIRTTAGWKRGTVAAIAAAPLPYLTGAKSVTIRERDANACGSHPEYGLTVITKTAETPNSAAVLAALIAEKPAGIILNYVVLTGQDYYTLYNAGATTYANVYATYATYQGVVNGVPGT